MRPVATFDNLEHFYEVRGGDRPGGECGFGRYNHDDLEWARAGRDRYDRMRVSVVYDTGDVYAVSEARDCAPVALLGTLDLPDDGNAYNTLGIIFDGYVERGRTGRPITWFMERISDPLPSEFTVRTRLGHRDRSPDDMIVLAVSRDYYAVYYGSAFPFLFSNENLGYEGLVDGVYPAGGIGDFTRTHRVGDCGEGPKVSLRIEPRRMVVAAGDLDYLFDEGLNFRGTSRRVQLGR